MERYHVVLKSSCRIEQCQLEAGARLQRCLAIYAIVAWRLLWPGKPPTPPVKWRFSGTSGKRWIATTTRWWCPPKNPRRCKWQCGR